MKKVFEKFGGVIFLYTTIVVMIIAVNIRFESLNTEVKVNNNPTSQISK